MITKFDLQMEFHKETGNVASRDFQLIGTLKEAEFHEWLIEKLLELRNEQAEKK